MQPKRSDADRRLRQSYRMARVFRILDLIQGRGRWTAKTLAEEIECAERTIYRDLQVLELAGIPYYYDKEEQCYRIRPDFHFPTLDLTEEESLGQAVATKLSEAPGSKIGVGAKPTTRKLESHSRQTTQKILADANHLIQVLDLKLADHSRHQEIIRTMQWALLERKQVIGHYRSPYESGEVQLRLHPYRLALIKNAWYLIGRLLETEAPQTYRIARFKSLRMIDEAAEIPEAFDLVGYFGDAWAVFRGDKTYEIEVLFSPEVADIVTETTWHHTQKVKRHKDGTVSLAFKVDGLNEIVRWVLGWAGRAKVVKPVELRDLVVKQWQAAIELNRK